MNDTSSTPRPDDETRPFGSPSAGQQTLDPGPPASGAEGTDPTGAGYPAHPGYPGYPPGPRPRFRDQVLGMRAVIAVALVALVIGGLGGALLGTLANSGGDDRFGGPGGFQRGFNQGQLPHQGLPHQQFQQGQP